MDLLSDQEHNRLVEKINRLPFGNMQAGIYKNALEELYSKHQVQLNGLFDTIKAYEEIAELVRQQQPLVNQRVYARVRRRQPEKMDVEPA
jgi:hypothetical protein